MCTVSFFPQNDGGFVFTSNRDETPLRPADAPAKHHYERGQWYGPRDPKAGGTWFGTNLHTTVCVLNGAFVKHQHRPPYRRSRGVLVPAVLQAESPAAFAAYYDFEGMEPFTLLVIEHAGDLKSLHEMRWDEQQLHHRQLPLDKPVWWQSATLYNAEQAALRSQWFRNWLETRNTPPTLEEAMHFHATAGDVGPELNLRMDRGQVKTTSITSLQWSPQTSRMHYFDFLQDAQHELVLF